VVSESSECMEHVKFQNPDMAWHIAANILFPPDFDRDHKYPTVVALHPFGSCKEQTAGNVYGPALAKEGCVVIVYDVSFQGESGGSPRWIEDPTQRVEDVSRVLDYAVTLPYVDAGRIGVLGICGGGREPGARQGHPVPEETSRLRASDGGRDQTRRRQSHVLTNGNNKIGGLT
jgi:fermentation-respiration switch protein FrsA (DUF1100 family)